MKKLIYIFILIATVAHAHGYISNGLSYDLTKRQSFTKIKDVDRSEGCVIDNKPNWSTTNTVVNPAFGKINQETVLLSQHSVIICNKLPRDEVYTIILNLYDLVGHRITVTNYVTVYAQSMFKQQSDVTTRPIYTQPYLYMYGAITDVVNMPSAQSSASAYLTVS
jgi:hypothetical protein